MAALFSCGVIRPITSLEDRPARVGPLFILAEVLVVLAVPLLGYLGVHALLDSRAGTFVESPGPSDPGYRALVDPSPVIAVVEMHNGRLTGVAVVSQPSSTDSGGAVLLVSGQLSVDGAFLTNLQAADAIAALEELLHLRIPRYEVVDESRWPLVLGDATFSIQNPDRVTAPDGSVLVDVGPAEITAASAPSVLGQVAIDADPRSLVFRRQLLWEAFLATPSETNDDVAALMRSVGSGSHRVEVLPVTSVAGRLLVDDKNTESILRELVPFPSGAVPGDRLRVRVLDRVGTVDLLELAAQLASEGYEVVEIGNAASLNGDPAVDTEVIVPLGMEDARIVELVSLVGADTIRTDQVDIDTDGVVTLLAGSNLS